MNDVQLHNTSMLRDGTLDGKVAIITGGGTGLGKAMAAEFSRLGASIVLASRKQENLERTASEIRESGGQVRTVQTDIRQPEQVEKMVDTAVSEFGKVDILVNNAAGNFRVDSLQMSINAWNSIVNIVLNGTWYCSQTVAKQMVKQGNGGAILNIGSVHALIGGPSTAHATSAKAGVLALTKTLAVEWAPYGIRVNVIVPGPIAGTAATEQLWPTPEAAEEILRSVPLQRLGTPQEVANLASYLSSDFSSYVTGACFVIDGGRWLKK